jgi:hypothetical protein
MNVVRHRRRRNGSAVSLKVLEQRESVLDDGVVRIEVEGTAVGVDGVGDLVVARFVERAQVEPDFRDIRVEADRSRVGVEGVAELVDLVVENADRAPERGVPSISVDGLLVGLVGSVVLLTRHERSTEEVPALGIGSVCECIRIKSRSVQ